MGKVKLNVPDPLDFCPACHKKTQQECSHVNCGRRKRVTVAVPDDASCRGMQSGGYYRKTYQDK